MKNASYPIIRSANEENLRAVTQCTLATCLLIASGFIIDTYLNPLQCPQVKHSSPTHHTYSAPPQQLLKPSKEAFKEALSTIPKIYKTPSIEAHILWDKEASKRSQMSLTNYAPKSLHLSKKLTSDPVLQKKLSTVYCPFQILGVVAHEKNISLQELQTDPTTCVELAMHKWAKSKELCVKKSPELKSNYLQLLHCAAGKYHGKGIDAENYADDFIKRYLKEKQKAFEQTLAKK